MSQAEIASIEDRYQVKYSLNRYDDGSKTVLYADVNGSRDLAGYTKKTVEDCKTTYEARFYLPESCTTESKGFFDSDEEAINHLKAQFVEVWKVPERVASQEASYGEFYTEPYDGWRSEVAKLVYHTSDKSSRIGMIYKQNSSGAHRAVCEHPHSCSFREVGHYASIEEALTEIGKYWLKHNKS